MTSLSEGRFAAVIDAFYEAAVAPEAWRMALDKAADAFGGEVAIVPFPDQEPRILCSTGYQNAVDAFVRGGWHEHNIRAQRTLRFIARDGVSASRLYSDRDLVSPDEADRNPFFQDFLPSQRLGYGFGIGGSLAEVDGRHVLISIDRRMSMAAFSRAERRLLEQLLARLRAAGSLALRMGIAIGEQTSDVLDRLGYGAALVDAAGRVIRANAHFEALRNSGVSLRNGRIALGETRAQASLDRLLGAALAAPDDALDRVVVSRPHQPPLIIEAVPLTGSLPETFQLARVLVVVTCPAADRKSNEEGLRSAFGLTRSEARLAAFLGTGESLDAAANRLGVSKETARAQLKSIFAKTDTHRQAQLVALLSKLGSAPNQA
jgi:DNA-binding CsgD family transcriptional regulator